MGSGSLRIVLDNTVLSNFKRINRMSLFSEILRLSPDEYYVTQYVLDEFGFVFDSSSINIPLIPISERDFQEYKKAVKIIPGWKGLGDGELSCMLSIGLSRADIMATDDVKARNCAEKEGIKLSGTLSLVEECVQIGLINADEAIQIVLQMKSKGFWLSAKLFRHFENRMKGNR